MNSVERVLTALRRQEPDRVPIVESAVDEKIARALAPGCKDTAECLDRLDLDAVGCSAFYEKTPVAADGTFRDEWGVTYKAGPEIVAHPIRGPIKTLADVKAYKTPDPDNPRRLGKLPDLVRRYKGKRAIRFSHRAAFMWSCYLMGMDRLLEGLLTEPETVCLLMDKVLETNLRIARNAVRAGAEVVALGDDYAHNHGPLMSPKATGEFLIPRLKKMVDAIHEEGALCIKHTDGNIYPILGLLVSSGIDCLNPIEPAAGMDLKTVKRLTGGKVALSGNIDCARLLPHGTEEEVREAVRAAMIAAAPGGGYLLGSLNSIHSSCNAANFLAMVRAGKEFGKYPIRC